MELIQVHDCKTGAVLLRPRTATEQAAVDAERALAAQTPPAPVLTLAGLNARLKVLEAK